MFVGSTPSFRQMDHPRLRGRERHAIGLLRSVDRKPTRIEASRVRDVAGRLGSLGLDGQLAEVATLRNWNSAAVDLAAVNFATCSRPPRRLLPAREQLLSGQVRPTRPRYESRQTSRIRLADPDHSARRRPV